MKKTGILVGFTLMTLVVTSTGLATGSNDTTFTDINKHWAKESIQSAVNDGYLKGYPDGTFKPDNDVTRAEYMKMVVDVLDLPTGSPAAGNAWYQPYVDAAVKANIHKASDFSNGDWNTPMTRLEMARIAIRAITPSLQQPNMMMDDKSFMYNATKKGIIRGMSEGELAVDGKTTRAQSVVVIQRILSVMSGKELPIDVKAASNAEVALRGTNIETMWGVRTKQLPLELETNLKDFKVTIDRVLISDMTDPQSPFYNKFPELKEIGAFQDGKGSLGDRYLVALHVNLENLKAKEKVLWPFDWKFEDSASYVNVYLHPIKKKQLESISFKESPNIWLDKVGSVDGWYFLAVKKDLVDSDDNYKRILLYNMMFQRSVEITAG